MATSAPALAASIPIPDTPPISLARRDHTLWAGFVAAIGALTVGIGLTGVDPRYFLQPTGLLIVVAGTLGVMLTGTPRAVLRATLERIRSLAVAISVNRESLAQELAAIHRVRRLKGLFAIENFARTASHPFLRELLAAAVDAPSKGDFQATIETRLRMQERQGDAAARVLETAGGFAPTLGVLGTVVGLIDVLRQFSNIAGVTGGIGTAFVSTIYGLALANLCLLPLACRIRSHNSETLEVNEMIFEAVLCIHEGVHPWQMRERLRGYLAEPAA